MFKKGDKVRIKDTLNVNAFNPSAVGKEFIIKYDVEKEFNDWLKGKMRSSVPDSDNIYGINYFPADLELVSTSNRKDMPIYSGVLSYFPDALLEVSKVSKAGSEQHNPGKPLHWDRSKSTDELDALTRHLIDAGKIDSDGIRHSAKIAWRALANLQKELENGRETL